MPTESAFEGHVSHQRRREVNHGFRYKVWMSFSKLNGSRLPRLLRPRTSKYLSRENLAELLSGQIPSSALERSDIWLLTQPSLIGRSFNPVSFYFVFDAEACLAVVATITNTPWGEEHSYVLTNAGNMTWELDKDFHVSPFMPMDMRYRWHFELVDDRILITMQLLEEGQSVFSAALHLRPAPKSRWLPVRLKCRYPLQNILTVVRIYWQAGLLKLRGATFHAHPKHDVPAEYADERSG
jgi:DUF1365 family protein